MRMQLVDGEHTLTSEPQDYIDAAAMSDRAVMNWLGVSAHTVLSWHRLGAEGRAHAIIEKYLENWRLEQQQIQRDIRDRFAANMTEVLRNT